MRNGAVVALAYVASGLLLSAEASADRDLKENLLSSAVMVGVVTKGDTSTASGFMFATPRDVFFVTARHVLFNRATTNEGRGTWILKGGKVNLRIFSGNPDSSRTATMSIDLSVASKRNGLLMHEEQDVAVVVIGHWVEDDNSMLLEDGVGIRMVEELGFNSVSRSATKSFREVSVGNTTYIFGFPTSIGLKSIPQIDPLKPLLRRGAIAGKNMSEMTLILDCPVYYGNSGGPVVQVEQLPLGVEYRVIGVVSEFVPFAETWINATHRYSYSELVLVQRELESPLTFGSVVFRLQGRCTR